MAYPVYATTYCREGCEREGCKKLSKRISFSHTPLSSSFRKSVSVFCRDTVGSLKPFARTPRLLWQKGECECGRAEQSGGRGANAAHNRPSPRAPIAPACSSQMARPRARRTAACCLLALVLGVLVLPATRGDAPIAAGAQLVAPAAIWFPRSAPAPDSGACSVPLDAKDMAQGPTLHRRALPRRTTMPDRREGPRRSCRRETWSTQGEEAARVDVAKLEADPKPTPRPKLWGGWPPPNPPRCVLRGARPAALRYHCELELLAVCIQTFGVAARRLSHLCPTPSLISPPPSLCLREGDAHPGKKRGAWAKPKCERGSKRPAKAKAGNPETGGYVTVTLDVQHGAYVVCLLNVCQPETPWASFKERQLAQRLWRRRQRREVAAAAREAAAVAAAAAPSDDFPFDADAELAAEAAGAAAAAEAAATAAAATAAWAYTRPQFQLT